MSTTGPARSRWTLPWGPTPVATRTRSDDELLLDVAAGDRQALATLYDHTAGLVYANIRRALHDEARTRAVAEEAFTEVWQQAAGFDPSRTPALIWILDIAHQLAAEHDRGGQSPVPDASEAQPSGGR